MERRLRNGITLMLAAQAFLFTGRAVWAQDPTQPGGHAVVRRTYDRGAQVFLPTDFNPVPMGVGVQRVEERAVVHYPADLNNGPYPIVFVLHGRHATVMGMAAGAPAPLLKWPPGAGEASIDSYVGYDYIGEPLASQGYVVVSISANGINAFDNCVADGGMRARVELIRRHIALWDQFSTVGGGPFPAPDDNIFVGNVDMDHIGLIGHSRGGEAVILCPSLAPAEPRIRSVLAIAPTDFNGTNLNRVPLGVILPYCDGDVSNLAGVHYYDRVRYNMPGDPAPKHTFLALGTNHNYYNTVWSDASGLRGSLDDWSFGYDFSTGAPPQPWDPTPARPAFPYTVVRFNRSDDRACGRTGIVEGAPLGPPAPPYRPVTNQGALRATRYTEAQQQANGLAIATAFVRTYVGSENVFRPLVKGDVPFPDAALPARTFTTYEPPFTAAARRDVNSQDPMLPTARNKLQRNDLDDPPGGMVASAGFNPAIGLCGVGMRCLPAQPDARQPHFNLLSMLAPGWNPPTPPATISAVDYNGVPAGTRDVSGYAAFQFRASVDFTDNRNYARPLPPPGIEPTGIEQDFFVLMVDEVGRRAVARVNAAARARALYFPPGDTLATWEVPRCVMNGVRIPLPAFPGVDLRRLTSIYFLFGSPPAPAMGKLFLSDIAFTD